MKNTPFKSKRIFGCLGLLVVLSLLSGALYRMRPPGGNSGLDSSLVPSLAKEARRPIPLGSDVAATPRAPAAFSPSAPTIEAVDEEAIASTGDELTDEAIKSSPEFRAKWKYYQKMLAITAGMRQQPPPRLEPPLAEQVPEPSIADDEGDPNPFLFPVD